MKTSEIPVLRAPAGTAWDDMTPEQQDQAFRDSIPHEEHLADGYYMVGCAACLAEEGLATTDPRRALRPA